MNAFYIRPSAIVGPHSTAIQNHIHAVPSTGHQDGHNDAYPSIQCETGRTWNERPNSMRDTFVLSHDQIVNDGMYG